MGWTATAIRRRKVPGCLPKPQRRRFFVRPRDPAPARLGPRVAHCDNWPALARFGFALPQMPTNIALDSVLDPRSRLSAITVPFEVEEQVQHPTIEGTFVALFVGVFPLAVDHLERDVLVRWARTEANDTELRVAIGIWIDVVHGRLALVDEVWVKDVEFVALDHFRWRIIVIIMSLIVPQKKKEKRVSTECSGGEIHGAWQTETVTRAHMHAVARVSHVGGSVCVRGAGG